MKARSARLGQALERCPVPPSGGSSQEPRVIERGVHPREVLQQSHLQEETVLARLLGVPDFATPLRRSGGACPVRGSAGNHVANRRRVPGKSCSASRTARPSSPSLIVGYDVLELFGRLYHVGQQLTQFGFLEWRQASVFLAAK